MAGTEVKKCKKGAKRRSVAQVVKGILKSTDMTLPEIVAVTLFLGMVKGKV